MLYMGCSLGSVGRLSLWLEIDVKVILHEEMSRITAFACTYSLIQGLKEAQSTEYASKAFSV